MGRLKIKRKVEWQRVTNRLVISFADPACIECKGALEYRPLAIVQDIDDEGPALDEANGDA